MSELHEACHAAFPPPLSPSLRHRRFDPAAGDLKGKQHLLDLTAQGDFPVIETALVGRFLDGATTIDGVSHTDRHPLLIKPINGADSAGQEFVSAGELRAKAEAMPKMRDGFVREFKPTSTAHYTARSFCLAAALGHLLFPT